MSGETPAVREALPAYAPEAPETERVPPGYRRTEVGVIPEDWEVVLLDSVAKRGSGHTPDKKRPEYWNGDIKWVSLKDTYRLDALYIDDTVEKITLAGVVHSSAVVHPAGTVILSRDAGVGKSAIIKEDMTVSQHFMAWHCGPKLNNHFLYYWLQAEKDEFERIAIGSTIKTIGLPYFKKLRIPLPPRDEQRAIAAALSDVDALIFALDKLIAKKRAIKTAAMQQLLTGKQRLPGFNGEWETKRLEDLGKTYGGITGKTKVDFGQGAARYIPFLNVMNNVVIDVNDLAYVAISDSEDQNRVKKDDLFFNGSSETPEELGMCSVLLDPVENVYLNSFCFGFRLKSGAEIHASYLAYFFRSGEGRNLLHSLAQGATRYNLSKVNFLKLEISLPKLNEQTAIAAVLSDMDAEIEALEARREKTRQVKQGMMQELLTGRTRLV